MRTTCLGNGLPCTCTRAADTGQKTPCDTRRVGQFGVGTRKRAWVGSEPAAQVEPPRGNSLPEDDKERGMYPMADGCIDYFPNALAEVSKISYEGNEKHNPGKPMHWARGKSTDHRNKIIRHTVDSLPETEKAIEHAAQAAWRALAYLQEKIERVRGVQVSGASR